MKKNFLFIVLFFLSVFNSSDALNIALSTANIPSPTRPRTHVLIPVSVDLSSADLYINFTTTVGVATITVTNKDGSIVEQQIIDTNDTNKLNIPLDELEQGDYTISISYGSITLAGEFTLK